MLILKKVQNKLLEYNNVLDIITTDKRNLILKITQIFLDKKSKNYKIISLFLKNLSDDYYIRDIIETNGCFLNNFNNDKIRSSFIDTYSADKIDISKSCEKNIFNTFLMDYNIKINNFNNIKTSNLNPKTKIINNLFLSDNQGLLDNIDYLNNYFNSEWDEEIDEMSLIKSICLISIIPLLHHPFYLNIFIDFETDTIKIDNFKSFLSDTEHKEHSINIIKKLTIAFHKICKMKLHDTKLVFFINVNYFEVNIQFYNKKMTAKSINVFNFNATDFFRLIRTFVGPEEYFLYDIGKSCELGDLTLNMFIQDKLSYILEYSNFYEKERREDLLF